MVSQRRLASLVLRILFAALLAAPGSCAPARTYWMDEGPAAAPPAAPGSTEDLRVAVREGKEPGTLDVRVVRVVRFDASGPVRKVEVDENQRWRLRDKLLAPPAAVVCIAGAPIVAVGGFILGGVDLVVEGNARGLALMIIGGPACLGMGIGYLASFVAFPFPLRGFTVLPFDEDPAIFDRVRTGRERVDTGQVPPGEYSTTPIGNVWVRVLCGAEAASGKVAYGWSVVTVELPDGVARPVGSRVGVEVVTNTGLAVLDAVVLARGKEKWPECLLGEFGDLPPHLPDRAPPPAE
jgi:hypothetical protein